MATRIKLYFIVFFAQCFFFIVGKILSRKAKKMRKNYPPKRRKKNKRKSLKEAAKLSLLFVGVCESLYSSLRVHLSVTNPIVCLILHINQTLRTRRKSRREKLKNENKWAQVLSAFLLLCANSCLSLLVELNRVSFLRTSNQILYLHFAYPLSFSNACIIYNYQLKCEAQTKTSFFYWLAEFAKFPVSVRILIKTCSISHNEEKLIKPRWLRKLFPPRKLLK